MTLNPKLTIDESDMAASIRDRYSVSAALTARAGGGQALGTPITAAISRFTVAATIGDSATLPVALPGANCTIVNYGATAMNVFPAVGGTINALTANTAFAIPAGKGCMFMCPVAGNWATVLGA